MTTRLSLSDRYYEALLREIQMHPAEDSADTLYFGGGTPSLAPVGVLQRIRDAFSLLPDSEITLEANPDNIGDDRLKGWFDAGINRLSIGVQSLEPNVLQTLSRTHTADTARKALYDARHKGFSNLSIDLMIGCPLQTAQGFLHGVCELIDFHPDHFSLYLLEVHEGTALDTQLKSHKLAIMEEDEQIGCYSQAVELLKQAGYEHYEVSNFALPGKQSRHNLKYWTNAAYYAYGAGAASFVRGVRSTNVRSVERYIQIAEEQKLPVETRTEEDAETTMRNALIFGLRKTQGINVEDFQNSYHVSPLELFGEASAEFLENRWLEMSGKNLRLTLSGMLLSNEILSVLV